MKNVNTKMVVFLLLAIVVLGYGLIVNAGNLEPAAPPAPTMKTLDEVEPRIPIPGSDKPASAFIISESGSYYLTGNRLCSGMGIQVGADDVTIDLMGYSLIGPASGTNYGVYMVARTNVEIRNGTVRDFSRGVYESNTSGREHRIIDVRTLSNSLGGIVLNGDGHLVKDCTASNNGESAVIYVYGIRTGDSGTVTGSTVNDNGTSATSFFVYGIYVGAGSTVIGNTVGNNGTLATGTIMGIYASSDSKVSDNTVSNNAQIGLQAVNNARVIDNTVEGNGTVGIKLTGTGSYISGNIVKGNTDNYDIVTGNQLNILLCEVPETIDWTAMVTLAGTLTVTAADQHGITVDANDVTIDLAGHSLVGPGSGTGNGIYMNGCSNVEIRNGTVRNFYYGIYESDFTLGENHRAIDVRSIFNSQSGINFHCKNNQVRGCTANNNGYSAGGDIVGIGVGSGSTVTGNTACNNGTLASGIIRGINTGTGCTVTGNMAYFNGTLASANYIYGIRTYNSSTVAGNTVYRNGYLATGLNVYGIYTNEGCTVIGNTVYDNGYSASGGIFGIYLGGNSLVDQNTSYSNNTIGSGINIHDNEGNCTFGTNHAP